MIRPGREKSLMSDDLRERVEAKHGPIHEQEIPTDPVELLALLRDDPDRFNALFEAGRIDPASLIPKKKGAK